jgi:TolB-like protein/DNA-binding winged helix-turn-helix (wHTH) protein
MWLSHSAISQTPIDRMPSEIHRFEDFELDRGAYELRRNGCVVRLERIPLELLCLLVERSGQIVTRGEILERVWGKGVFVDSDSSINTAMRKIRRALDDGLDPPKFIATIPTKGYRFIASVQTLNAEASTNSESVQVSVSGAFNGDTPERVPTNRQVEAWVALGFVIIAAVTLFMWYQLIHPAERTIAGMDPGKPPRKLPDETSIAVLPFVNLSGYAEQNYLIDGISDDLINALSRRTNIFVIARTSSFAYRSIATGAQEIGRELGVKYLLEGSVHKAGDGVRVNSQLVDTATGGLLWAGRYEISQRDTFALPDKILEEIITTLGRQVGGSGEAYDSSAVSRTTRGLRDCLDPAKFGAVPNDEIDDSVPLQQALDMASAAGGRVCFGPGRWRLSRMPIGTHNRFAALSIRGAHVEIQGAGPRTVLEVVGDQEGASTGVISVNPGAHDITIRDLTIDTSAATNTDEQFHAIEIGNGVGTGTIQDVRIEHVRFNHPGAHGLHKGDCIHIAGNTPQSAVHRVTITGATFMSCARSNITIQKNVFDLIIQESQFTESKNHGINSEPASKNNNPNGPAAIMG